MSKSKRVLITGASGLLGRHLMGAFSRDTEWQTIGLAFSRAKDNLKKVDLTNSEELSQVIKEFMPTVILHSAAERRPDVVEKEQEKTENINIKATQKLCDIANEIGASVLFISTDYVFDGKAAPYKTTDLTNPLNKYGLSKAEGEKLVLKSSPDNMVLRVPLLYGQVEFLEESAVTILFKKVKDTSSSAEMNHFERRYPTLCADVAEAAKVLLEAHLKSSTVNGVYHWSGTEMMTKYDMAVAMAQVFGLPTDHLVADTKPATGAPRPYDCCLDSSRLDALGHVNRTPFKDAIKQVLAGYSP